MSLLQNVKSGLCISCGMCTYLAPRKLVLKYNKHKGLYTPCLMDSLSDNEEYKIDNVCPAQGYPIVSMGKQIHNDVKLYDYRIGYYYSFVAARSLSDDIVRKASSGGIMTALAYYMLSSGLVEGVIATKYLYDNNGGIIPKTIVATSLQELLDCQGSKYMPVPIFDVLNTVKNYKRLAFIGTPCQIATLRRLQNLSSEYNNIIYTIGNFCGGYRDLRELTRLKKIAGFGKEPITHFQYRGNGQPGQMVIEARNKRWTYPYPKYSKLTGNIKYYRCRVCIDATAELADVSCGDAWLPRFIQGSDKAWSIVIIRNRELSKIVEAMETNGLIKTEKILLDELIQAQKQNIISKKERFVSRIKFLRKIGKTNLPIYDGGYNPSQTTSVMFEAKVWFSQLYKVVLERLGLYSYIIHQ